MNPYQIKFNFVYMPPLFEDHVDNFISDNFYNVFKINENYLVSSFLKKEELEEKLYSVYSYIPFKIRTEEDQIKKPQYLQVKNIISLESKQLETKEDFDSELDRILEKIHNKQELTLEENRFLEYYSLHIL